MRDPEFIDRCEEDLERLLEALRGMPVALRKAAEDRAPIKAQNCEADRVSGGSGSDPTGTLGIKAPRSSLAASNLRAAWTTVHSMVETIRFETEHLLSMETVSDPRRAEAARIADMKRRRRRAEGTAARLTAELAVAQRTPTSNEHRCWSCARVETSPGVAWDCGGELRRTDATILDEPRPLCRWTRDYVRDFGELPTVDEVEQHRQGNRLRRSA